MAPSDTNLLDRWVQRKDAEAFGELVTRYADFVYGACLRVLRNDADAQDAAQNCFLRLARSPGEAPSNLPAWLHAVATRGSIDLVRRGARRRERERQFAEQSPPQAETSDSVEWREISMEIDRCISELPDELRYVIVARFLERKTHESIASDLNVSRQTVARRVDEGVQLLRKSLHRRGLSIGAATLGATLLHSMVEAAGPAPAALVANLGRMALSGVPSAASAFTLTGVVSGGIVVKKLFASAVAALVLCASVAWLVFRDDGPFVGDPSSSEGAELVRSEDPGVPVADRSAGRPNERRAEADPPAHGDDGTRRLRLRGQVIDQGGREVVGAQVVAQADQRVVVRGTSGDGGAFELAVPEGKEIVLAAYDEREGLSALLVSSSDSPGEEYELALQPLSTISGRIYDKETGQGVSRLPVSLVRRSNENESIETVEGIAAALFSGVVAGRRPQAVTDEEGHYIFRTPGPLVASLALKADVSGYIVPGYRTDQPLPVVEVEAAEILEGVDVSLSAGASISGVVVDPQGRGAGKVRVELVPSFPARYIRRVGTNNEGRFRFSGLPTQSSYRVRATKEGFAAVESETVSVPLATEIADIELQLVEGRQISGRFVDERGGPVARLSFTLEKVFESRLQGTGHRPILTDEDGYFE
ncbi:MAG: sigma-70 family RNA polymerase sigma factor, partial [Planctomycetota bacterium]